MGTSTPPLATRMVYGERALPHTPHSGCPDYLAGRPGTRMSAETARKEIRADMPRCREGQDFRLNEPREVYIGHFDEIAV